MVNCGGRCDRLPVSRTIPLRHEFRRNPPFFPSWPGVFSCLDPSSTLLSGAKSGANSERVAASRSFFAVGFPGPKIHAGPLRQSLYRNILDTDKLRRDCIKLAGLLAQEIVRSPKCGAYLPNAESDHRQHNQFSDIHPVHSTHPIESPSCQQYSGKGTGPLVRISAAARLSR
jgi:hypothetical protein